MGQSFGLYRQIGESFLSDRSFFQKKETVVETVRYIKKQGTSIANRAGVRSRQAGVEPAFNQFERPIYHIFEHLSTDNIVRFLFLENGVHSVTSKK